MNAPKSQKDFIKKDIEDQISDVVMATEILGGNMGIHNAKIVRNQQNSTVLYLEKQIEWWWPSLTLLSFCAVPIFICPAMTTVP